MQSIGWAMSGHEKRALTLSSTGLRRPWPTPLMDEGEKEKRVSQQPWKFPRHDRSNTINRPRSGTGNEFIITTTYAERLPAADPAAPQAVPLPPPAGNLQQSSRVRDMILDERWLLVRGPRPIVAVVPRKVQLARAVAGGEAELLVKLQHPRKLLPAPNSKFHQPI